MEVLSLNRVVLGNGAFCLLIAQITQSSIYDNPLDANGCFASKLENELLQNAVYHMLPLHGLVVCCISMLQYTTVCDAVYRKESQLHEFCQKAIVACKKEDNLDVLVAASPISFGVESLSGSFRCTMDLLQMSAFNGQQSGLVTDTARMPPRNIYFFLELEQSCSVAQNLLQSQDFPGFIQCVLDQVHALGDIRPTAMSIFFANCYRYLDLLCCRLAQVGMMNAQILEHTDLWGILHRSVTIQELDLHIQQILDELTSAYRKKWTAREQARVQEIQQYIAEHITSPFLSVSTMAEHFGMSQPAFSSYYKKHTGVAPLEYLTQLRINCAKQLLQTTDYTLPEIAEQAGFGSLSSLHRIFKAQTGITPARLRINLENTRVATDTTT